MAETAEKTLELQAATLLGLEGKAVRLVVSPKDRGILTFEGWKESAAREVKVRVVSALAALPQPLRLDEPAALRVQIDREDWSGAELDLAVAVALAAYAGGRVLPAQLAGVALVAELALDGRLRPVRGVVSLAEEAKARGARLLVVAPDSRREAEQVGGLRVESPALLSDVLLLLSRDLAGMADGGMPHEDRDGAADAWRAAREAVDGGARYLLLVGPPGAGKTVLARTLAARLPVMDEAERLEVARVTSAAGLAHEGQGWAKRPFRAPHYSCSPAGLVGGGSGPRPGEVSLAHLGTLLIDQAPEFSMRLLDVLGEVLLRRQVEIAAGGKRCAMPAAPRLVVVAMNPCPCGYHGSRRASECRCDPDVVRRYQGRGLGKLGELLELTVRLP